MVVTTVGPYALYGEPLVAACAAAGTDYVDLTGEPEFVDRMWLGYHARGPAQRGPASALLRLRLDPARPRRLLHRQAAARGRAADGQRLRAHGRQFSGGTFHSAVNALGRGRQTVGAARSAAGRAAAGWAKGPLGAARPRRDSDLGGWVVPLPTIDGPIVRRSAAALERYGPDFSYGHDVVASTCTPSPVSPAGSARSPLLAPLPPTRKLLLKLESAGRRPERGGAGQELVQGQLRRRGRRRAGRHRGCRRRPRLRRDPKMLAESALCLAFDDLPRDALAR